MLATLGARDLRAKGFPGTPKVCRTLALYESMSLESFYTKPRTIPIPPKVGEIMAQDP